MALVMLTAVRLDVRAHRRDGVYGINQWGHRGPARVAKRRGELRIAFVGGTAAFAAGTPWKTSVPVQLADAMNTVRGWNTGGGPIATADNLAEPGASADSFINTLRDYAYLQADVICIYDGYDAMAEGVPPTGRRRSVVFRTVGYLPMLPAMVRGRRGWLSDPNAGVAAALRDGTGDSSDPSCSGSSASYCAAMVATVQFALDQGKAVVVATPPYVSVRHEAQRRALAAMLAQRFGSDARFRYVNLGRSINLQDSMQSLDGTFPAEAGRRAIAAQLADGMLDVLTVRIQR